MTALLVAPTHSQQLARRIPSKARQASHHQSGVTRDQHAFAVPEVVIYAHKALLLRAQTDGRATILLRQFTARIKADGSACQMLP